MPDKLAQQLLDAADKLDVLPRSDVQALLRRASFRVENKAQESGKALLIREVAEVMDEYATAVSMSRDEAVNAALLDWAISMGLIEIEDLDEEG